jgi:hypothetical protein
MRKNFADSTVCRRGYTMAAHFYAYTSAILEEL